MSSGPLSSPPDKDAPASRTAVPRELPSAQPRDPWRRWLQIGLPVAALLVAFGIRSLLYATAPSAVTADPPTKLPWVDAQIVLPETLRLEVVAHGTVTPRTESDLVAEVRGRVVEVAETLEAGAFFSQGDELLRLDGREHAIALDRARAIVKLRESEARLADREAERRQKLAKRDAASASDLQQFESRADVAAASLDEAKAQLAQAQLDLDRTILRAPFDGRVRERHADVGQFVNPGAVLARIYAVDYAEVRLPVRMSELSYLDLPARKDASAPSPVILSAELGGRLFEWPAVLARSEGSIDPQTRMMHVVARVDDPQARANPGREALPAGLFVRARIQGREIAGAYRLPVLALHEGSHVYVVDDEGRLGRRDVEIVQLGRHEVVVDHGLSPGDRVVVSPLRLFTEGMRVRVTNDDRQENAS
jgi:RND family efflux transporter MFP subunit